METVKVVSVEISKFKRIEELEASLPETGIYVIGGRNGQGKTSAIDAIAWAVGGDKFRPSDPNKDGATAAVKIALSNGMVVERAGKNGSLKVTDKGGGRGGQTMLNQFISAFSLNLPDFMSRTPVEKAKLLLDVFPGLGDRLAKLNAEHDRAYQDRESLGRDKERALKHAQSLPYHPDASPEPVSIATLTAELQAALEQNSRNSEQRIAVARLEDRKEQLRAAATFAAEQVEILRKQLAEAEARLEQATSEAIDAQTAVRKAKEAAAKLVDVATDPIKKRILEVEDLNAKVRANETRKAAEAEARRLEQEYYGYNQRIEKIRRDRLELLNSVKMPITGLSIEGGQLIYEGQAWDCMATSDQFRVATAICAAIKPACGFVLLDRLEVFDLDSLKAFDSWVRNQGLQVIGTRVSTGGECSIVIEDGTVN